MSKKPLIILVAMLIFFGLTNPSKEQYVLWVKNKLIEQSGDNAIGGLVSVFAPVLIDGSTSITNFMIFSTFTTEFDNKEYVTLGILNKFITLHDGMKDIPENKVKKSQNIISAPQPIQQLVDVDGRTPGADNFKKSNMSGYKTYVNGRYGFNIAYPQDFTSNKPPTNGDGLKFISPDKKASLTVYGSNNGNDNLFESYNTDIKNIKGELGYKDIGDNWYVITWKENGDIYYSKTFLGTKSSNSFRFVYPEDQKSKYDDVVIILEKSFKPGEINQAW